MSSSRRRRREAPLPATGAGLLRFFEEETKGIKIKPHIVLATGALLIAMVLLLRILFPIS
ncbi:MAG: preprotein translocase subunit Sec61beta [Nitrososphaerota archaeon]|nr:preprotein translocase subunit Sec61beta [Candidatus Calditenuaceae archaeon]MDW8073530.1 preprotein translocase subunit Sec61beta [Nitrososphaerota archaeon]